MTFIVLFLAIENFKANSKKSILKQGITANAIAMTITELHRVQD